MTGKSIRRFKRIKEIVMQVCPSASIVLTALDPKYDVDGLIARAGQWSFDGNIPENPCFTVIKDEPFFNKLCAIASSTTLPYEKDLEDKALIKWNKPQGGKQDITEVLTSLHLYGDTAELPEHLPVHWQVKMELLIPTVAQIGDPLLRTAADTWHSWTPAHKSSGGIRHFGDRRDPRYRQACVKAAMTNWLDPDPMVPASRLKDSKVRVIFMDTLSNYFREARMFYRMFETWSALPINHHYSDRELEERFAQCAIESNGNCSAYGGDYKGMDYHLRLPAAVCSIKILTKICGCQDYEDEVIQDFTKLWNSMTVAIGDTVYIQKNHALYSGLYPTHDLEGPLNYYILVETANTLHLLVDHSWNNPNWQVRIIVCGDDSAVIFNWNTIHTSDKHVFMQKFARIHAYCAKQYGQVMELSKVEISDEFVPFCKRRYYFVHQRGVTLSDRNVEGHAIPLSKYSLIKTLNALYHPEHLPRFDTDWGWLVWTCSILDCASGMTKWSDIIDAIARSIAEDDRAVQRVVNPRGEAHTDMPLIMADWWFRQSFASLEGGVERFLKTSKSYQKLYSLTRRYAGLE